MRDPQDSLVGSGRPSPLRAIAAIVALAGVVGAGAYLLNHTKGQLEDPARVLIVGTNPALVDFLERRGFDPAYLSVGQAIGEGQAFDRSLDELPAMLEYADQLGFGYLALDMAYGQHYEFSTIGYEADPAPEGTTFAVVSVGELGKTVSFGGVVPQVEHEAPIGEQVGLLLGLFGQDAIAKARTRDASNDLMIRFGAARTVEDVIAYEKGQAQMARQVEAWTRLSEGERAETKPTELARAYEPLRGWPLATGEILLVAAHGAWRSADGRTTTWSGEDLDASFSVVTTDEPSRRQPCESLPELGFDDAFALSPAGDAMLIPSDAMVADLWILSGPGCHFDKLGPIRRLEQGVLGQPRASGRTAVAVDGRVQWAEVNMRAYHQFQLDGLGVRAGSLSWIADDLLVAVARVDFVHAAASRARRVGLATDDGPGSDEAELPVPTDALVFIELPSKPGAELERLGLTVVTVDALVVNAGQVLPGPLSIGEVVGVPARPGVAMVTVDGMGSALLRVTPRRDAPWSDALALDYDLVTAVDQGSLMVSSEFVGGLAEVEQPSFSADGRFVAWSAPVGEDEQSLEIWLLSLATADARPLRLTDNDRADRRPRFVGGGLVFDSVYMGDAAPAPVEALRLLAVDGL